MSLKSNRLNLNPLVISVVFSFRNEEDVLVQLIERTRQVFHSLKTKKIVSNYELIFVNDDSTDHSLPILLEQSKIHKDIRIINMSRVFGVSPCVMAGLAHAQGEAVIYMDADLQDPPEVIPQMIETWQKEQADVVHTVRRTRKGESRIKLAMTKIGYWTLNRFSRINLPMEAGDFKLLSRRVVTHLLQMKEHRPFMRGLVCWVGFKQEFIPYDREPRQGGETKFPIFSVKVISNFFSSALVSFSSGPLKIAAFLGIFAILLDFIFIGHVFFEKFSGRAIPGWTAIMVAVLFIGGVQLFCTGIIGLYLNSVHEESKARPLFIVESTYGFAPETVSQAQKMAIPTQFESAF